MVNKKVWLAGALLLGLAAVWLLFGDSEVKRVRRQFAKASELFARSADSKKVTLVRNARAIKEMLTDPCEINVPEYETSGTFSSRDLSQRALAAMMQAVDLSLEFYDLEVVITGDDTASASVTAHLTWRSGSSDNYVNTQELLCILKKTDDKWRFHSVTVIDVLEK